MEYPGDNENCAYVRQLLADKDPVFRDLLVQAVLAELGES